MAKRRLRGNAAKKAVLGDPRVAMAEREVLSNSFGEVIATVYVELAQGWTFDPGCDQRCRYEDNWADAWGTLNEAEEFSGPYTA